MILLYKKKIKYIVYYIILTKSSWQIINMWSSESSNVISGVRAKYIQWCRIKQEQHKFKLNSSHKSLKTTLYNFFFYYFKGIGFRVFINKINYFLLCPFFSFLASLLVKSKSTCGIK